MMHYYISSAKNTGDTIWTYVGQTGSGSVWQRLRWVLAQNKLQKHHWGCQADRTLWSSVTADLWDTQAGAVHVALSSAREGPWEGQILGSGPLGSTQLQGNHWPWKPAQSGVTKAHLRGLKGLNESTESGCSASTSWVDYLIGIYGPWNLGSVR